MMAQYSKQIALQMAFALGAMQLALWLPLFLGFFLFYADLPTKALLGMGAFAVAFCLLLGSMAYRWRAGDHGDLGARLRFWAAVFAAMAIATFIAYLYDHALLMYGGLFLLIVIIGCLFERRGWRVCVDAELRKPASFLWKSSALVLGAALAFFLANSFAMTALVHSGGEYGVYFWGLYFFLSSFVPNSGWVKHHTCRQLLRLHSRANQAGGLQGQAG